MRVTKTVNIRITCFPSNAFLPAGSLGLPEPPRQRPTRRAAAGQRYKAQQSEEEESEASTSQEEEGDKDEVRLAACMLPCMLERDQYISASSFVCGVRGQCWRIRSKA